MVDRMMDITKNKRYNGCRVMLMMRHKWSEMNCPAVIRGVPKERQVHAMNHHTVFCRANHIETNSEVLTCGAAKNAIMSVD
jgi:hypothetical protein